MRRAVILTTLTLLLLALAGVTGAHERAFVAGSGGNELAEPGVSGSTFAESMALKAAYPETIVPEGVDEGTAEAIIRKPENTGRSVVANPVDRDRPEATHEDEDASKTQDVRRQDRLGGTGKPEHAGAPEGAGKPAGRGKPENEPGGGGQREITLCHKSKVTITVDALARNAHLRHGDDPGACE